MYCLLREVVKQKPPPITAGCRMKDVMRRYEGETALAPCICCMDEPKCSLQVLMRLPAPLGKIPAWVAFLSFSLFSFFVFVYCVELTLQAVAVKLFPVQFPARSQRLSFRLIKILGEGGLSVSGMKPKVNVQCRNKGFSALIIQNVKTDQTNI